MCLLQIFGGVYVDKRNYYANIVDLFESTKENLSEVSPFNQTEKEPIRQVPNQIDPPQAAPVAPPVGPGLSDADYLQDPMMMEPELSPVEQEMEVSEQKKKLKLLELYRELITYSTVFHDSLDVIDTNLLDSDKNQDLRELKTKLLKLSEKLKDFVVDRFADETYEKALYLFILLRTELLTIIKMLRHLLGVNKNETKKELKARKKGL